MAVGSKFLGYRDLFPEDGIIDAVKESRRFEGHADMIGCAQRIFVTQRQQTWLVVIGECLYCVLDDVRGPSPRVQWSAPMASIVSSEGEMLLSLDVQPKSLRTVAIDLGRRRRWLATKRIFGNGDVGAGIAEFLLSAAKADR